MTAPLSAPEALLNDLLHRFPKIEQALQEFADMSVDEAQERMKPLVMIGAVVLVHRLAPGRIVTLTRALHAAGFAVPEVDKRQARKIWRSGSMLVALLAFRAVIAGRLALGDAGKDPRTAKPSPLLTEKGMSKASAERIVSDIERVWGGK